MSNSNDNAPVTEEAKHANSFTAQVTLGAVVALLAGYILVEISRYPVDPRIDVQPGFFPMLIAVALLICAGVVFWQAFSHRNAGQGTGKGEASARQAGRLQDFFWFTGLLLVYVLLLTVLGYATSTFLFLLGAGYLLGERRPVRLGISAAAITLVVYVLFVELLNVSLPTGLLI